MTVYIGSEWGINNIDFLSKVAKGNPTYYLTKLMWQINTKNILDSSFRIFKLDQYLSSLPLQYSLGSMDATQLTELMGSHDFMQLQQQLQHNNNNYNTDGHNGLSPESAERSSRPVRRATRRTSQVSGGRCQQVGKTESVRLCIHS